MLLVAVVTTFLWAAYREVEATLVRAGGETGQGRRRPGGGVCSSGRRRPGWRALRRVAADPERAPVPAELRPTPPATRRARAWPRSQPRRPRRIELWSAAGSRVLDVSNPAATPVIRRRRAAGDHRPAAVGFNPLQAMDNVVFTDSAADVLGDPPSTSAATPPVRSAYVVVRSTFRSTRPGRSVASSAWMP